MPVTTVVGLYDLRDDAQDAVEDLMNAGFSRDRISVIASDPEGRLQQYRSEEETTATMAGEGAATGIASGAIVGGLLGVLVGVGTIFLPAGLVVAGPLAGLIAGATAGAATGGILGGLIGLGVPKEHAEAYAESVRRGGTLVTIQIEDDEDVQTVHRILNRDGAANIEDRAASYRAGDSLTSDEKLPTFTAAESAVERAPEPKPSGYAYADKPASPPPHVPSLVKKTEEMIEAANVEDRTEGS